MQHLCDVMDTSSGRAATANREEDVGLCTVYQKKNKQYIYIYVLFCEIVVAKILNTPIT